MSSYRDDMNDTLRLQGDAVSKLHDTGESTVRLGDGVVHQLQTLTEDSVALSDVCTDRATIARSDGVALGDAVFGAATKRSTITEKVHIGDAIILKGKSLVAESIALADDTKHAAVARVRDGAAFSDEVLGRRRVVQLVVDGVRLNDAAPRLAREMVADGIVVSDAYSGKLRATGFFFDSIALAAEDDTDTTIDGLLVERLRITDEVVGMLHARNTVADGLALWDEVLQTGDYGQAWTASTDSWAMSRFAPFTFTSMAVIDGVAYGTGAGGVFALDGNDEPITALLRTGRLDVTNGTLVRLVEAPMEYELDGTAALDVTETQNGVAPETYTYEPDARDALVLTNSRFQLGRGLKGRHFTFALSLQGRRGYINDLRVTVAPSKRSM